MAYLITGGTGYIASWVIRDLVREGEKVVAYDVDPDNNLWKRLLGEEAEKIQFVQGDITDLGHLIHTAKEYQVNKIIHMAALLPFTCDANPWLAVKVNCEGTNNVFETARILGLEKVVWASSCNVFGAPEKYPGVIANDAPQYPLGLYGACKSFNERQAENYFNRFGVDNTGLRFVFTFGIGRRPGLSAGGLITAELVEKPASGKPGKVPYGVDFPNWLYIEDTARAVVLASRVGRTRTRVYNLGGEIHSVKEVAGWVKDLIPDADITMEPGTMGCPWKFDTSRIEEEIGFRPEWPLQKAIREMLNMLRREHGLPTV